VATPDDEPVRVLLCDDDVGLTKALATLIRFNPGLALVADPVRTGAGAVDSVDLHHPDVVLMDVNLLGQMDGYQATVLIKERSPATNVVILSSVSNAAQALTDALHAGAFTFLPKTCPSSDIVDAVRSAGRATRESAMIKPA
jgi:DNA-binding NarL/FixJ family response regulator